MNSTFLDKCTAIKLDWTFFVLNVFLLVLAIISAVGNAFICFILTKSHSLPSNVSLLLKNTALTIAGGAVCGVLRVACNFYIWSTDLIPVTRFLCTFLEMPAGLFVLAFSFSISGIGIDRLINTVSKDQRIDLDKPSLMGYAMLVSAWCVSFLSCTGTVVFGYFDPSASEVICYCNSILASPTAYSRVIAPVFLLMELFTVFCYLLVYKHSRSSFLSFTINTTQHSLAHRYQTMSNIKTTVLLMPTIVLHGLTYVALCAAISYLAVAVDGQPESLYAINFVMAVGVISLIEGLSHPIWLLARHEHILKAASNYVPFLKRFLETEDPNRKQLPAKHAARQREPENIIQRKPRLAVLPTSNKITAGVVSFHVKPEQNNDILAAIWATKPGYSR